MAHSARITRLREAIRKSFKAVDELKKDPRVVGLQQKWIIDALWDAKDPMASNLPDPDLEDNKIMDDLCKRFGV